MNTLAQMSQQTQQTQQTEQIYLQNKVSDEELTNMFQANIDTSVSTNKKSKKTKGKKKK